MTRVENLQDCIDTRHAASLIKILDTDSVIPEETVENSHLVNQLCALAKVCAADLQYVNKDKEQQDQAQNDETNDQDESGE